MGIFLLGQGDPAVTIANPYSIPVSYRFFTRRESSLLLH